MRNLKDILIEGFYKNLGIKELKEWYNLNNRLVKSKNTLLIDKDTNELVVKFNWKDDVRVNVLKYLEWLKDYMYTGAYQSGLNRMDISWEKVTPNSGLFKIAEHISMTVDREDNTLVLTYSEGGRNSKKLYDGKI